MVVKTVVSRDSAPVLTIIGAPLQDRLMHQDIVLNVQDAEQRAARRAAQVGNASTLYDQDFADWCLQQARLLRDGKISGLDLQNLAEEIESLAKRDKRELKSRLIVLIVHLLKWNFQPTHRSAGWRGTILEQSSRIADITADSPSLDQFIDALLPAAYPQARAQAAIETGLPESISPAGYPDAVMRRLMDRKNPDGPLHEN